MSPASVLSAAREAKVAPCSIARNNNTGPAIIGTALSQPPIRGPQRRLPSVTPAMKSGTSVSLRAKSMVDESPSRRRALYPSPARVVFSERPGRPRELAGLALTQVEPREALGQRDGAGHRLEDDQRRAPSEGAGVG